jgi:hypothetical protein
MELFERRKDASASRYDNRAAPGTNSAPKRAGEKSSNLLKNLTLRTPAAASFNIQPHAASTVLAKQYSTPNSIKKGRTHGPPFSHDFVIVFT